MSLRAPSTSAFLASTTTTPLGPMFFCAPAYTRSNLVTSNFFHMKSLDMSAMSGTFPTSGQ